MSFIEKTVKKFLATRVTGRPSLILGWSGGRDSMALLFILRRIREEIPFDLHLAHLDHGWRPESAEEATRLGDLAKSLGLPFHHRRLEASKGRGNLEALGREARYDFFKQVSDAVGARAVLLAHHANDQAENALKGVLQGNALPFVGGMRPESVVSKVLVWRPLLEIPKRVIEDYLTENNLDALDDATNRDERFLRARMRQSLIPRLSEAFGKEISSSLTRLAKESFELRDYLDGRCQSALERQIKGPFGLQLFVDPSLPVIERRHLVRRFCLQKDLILPAAQVERVCELLQEGLANKRVQQGRFTLYMDRSRLFIVAEPLENIRWQMTVDSVEPDRDFQSVDWTVLWREGATWAVVPAENYFLGKPMTGEPYHGKSSLSKWWNDHKIPAFLRAHVPVLWTDSGQRHEFLTGQCWVNDKREPAVKVKIEALLL